MFQSISATLFRLLHIALLNLIVLVPLLPLLAAEPDRRIENLAGTTTDSSWLVPASPQIVTAANDTPVRYFFTFGTGTPTDADFISWGGARSTSCGTGCTYDQNIVLNGNPAGALTLFLTGLNGKGGAGPRQNGVSLSTATDFEYSADVYVYNGQLDARYGLAFDASSGTFPGSGVPPMATDVNYYLLELRMDTTTRSKVAGWQFLRVVNGSRQALTTVTALPVAINQGQWHNLKVVQQGGTLSFYLNGQYVISTPYDPAWGDARRRFGLYIDVRASNGTSGPFEFFADNIMVADVLSIGVELNGPPVGLMNVPQVFTATATPIGVTTPITYIWQATDQLPVVHSSESITDSVSFVWALSGTKMLTVTALNDTGVATATQSIEVSAAPLTVTVAGPATGETDLAYAFAATTTSITATTPITYLWQATDQIPVVHSSNLMTDSVSFAWAQSGTKTITITVVNTVGVVTATHLLELKKVWRAFLPTVIEEASLYSIAREKPGFFTPSPFFFPATTPLNKAPSQN